MASTNKTPNYDLPQWVAADKPTFLGDMNAAFLDIDTAMHENAESSGSQEQRLTAVEAKATENATNIANVSQVANTAGETATAAQNAASAASALATTANQNAGKAQTTADAITSGLTFQESNVIRVTYDNPGIVVTPPNSANFTSGAIRCANSDNGAFIKIYGYLTFQNMKTSTSEALQVKLPGLVKNPPKAPYTIQSLGMSYIWNETPALNAVAVIVNTDGSVTLEIWAAATVSNTATFINLSPCLIANKDFGDTSEQPTQFEALKAVYAIGQ